MHLLIVKHRGAAAAILPGVGSVIAICHSGTIYADNGATLGQNSLRKFCRSLGAKSFGNATPNSEQRRILKLFMGTKKSAKGQNIYIYKSPLEKKVIAELQGKYKISLGRKELIFIVPVRHTKVVLRYPGDGIFFSTAGIGDDGPDVRTAIQKIGNEYAAIERRLLSE